MKAKNKDLIKQKKTDFVFKSIKNGQSSNADTTTIGTSGATTITVDTLTSLRCPTG